jgi:hypothetical protein
VCLVVCCDVDVDVGVGVDVVGRARGVHLQSTAGARCHMFIAIVPGGAAARLPRYSNFTKAC